MRFRFLVDESGVHGVAREYLNHDIRQARLSWLFRFYYALRPLIPLRFRQQLQRHRRVPATADWFLPHTFMKLIGDAVGRGNRLPIVHPWPDNARYSFVLTHDIETEAGLKHVEALAAIEEELGFRSSWNVVPHKYRVDMGLIADLQRRGFEIGVHGYNHDGRLFSSLREFSRRVPAMQKALARFGAVGFRSPMVHRNLNWLQALDIEYDASCFDIDPYQPMPGGVGAVWPFMFGRFVELPYTLPQDHTLFLVRGEHDDATWRRKLEFLQRISGIALMLTHPDYLATEQLRSIYRGFLEYVKCQGDYWHALPRDVARWWQIRDATTLRQQPSGEWSVAGPCPERTSLSTMEVEDDSLKVRLVRQARAH